MIAGDSDYKAEMGRRMGRDNLGIDNVPWATDGGGKRECLAPWKVWVFAQEFILEGRESHTSGLRESPSLPSSFLTLYKAKIGNLLN